jgi:hypothetical protein
MAKTSIRRLVSPQPRPYERFVDVLRRRLRQRRPLSVARRPVPLLALRTCEAHFYFGLLEMGGLHAARFDDDGTGEGLPLTFGQGPLPTANDLALQADLLDQHPAERRSARRHNNGSSRSHRRQGDQRQSMRRDYAQLAAHSRASGSYEASRA